MNQDSTIFQFHPDGILPSGNWVFVFGANLAGRHGKGAAKAAAQHFGAVRGVGAGPTGMAYAIPTKDQSLAVLPIATVQWHIDAFKQYAMAHPDLNFFVTRVGTVLAGRSDAQMAPLFRGCPSNCSFAEQWKPFLVNGAPA